MKENAYLVNCRDLIVDAIGETRLTDARSEIVLGNIRRALMQSLVELDEHTQQPNFICPFCEREIHGFDYCVYCHEEFVTRNPRHGWVGFGVASKRKKFWQEWMAHLVRVAGEIVLADMRP